MASLRCRYSLHEQSAASHASQHVHCTSGPVSQSPWPLQLFAHVASAIGATIAARAAAPTTTRALVRPSAGHIASSIACHRRRPFKPRSTPPCVRRTLPPPSPEFCRRQKQIYAAEPPTAAPPSSLRPHFLNRQQRHQRVFCSRLVCAAVPPPCTVHPQSLWEQQLVHSKFPRLATSILESSPIWRSGAAIRRGRGSPTPRAEETKSMLVSSDTQPASCAMPGCVNAGSQSLRGCAHDELA